MGAVRVSLFELLSFAEVAAVQPAIYDVEQVAARRRRLERDVLRDLSDAEQNATFELISALEMHLSAPSADTSSRVTAARLALLGFLTSFSR